MAVHVIEEAESIFGEDLMQSLNQALAHAKSQGPAIVHAPVTPREVRKQARLTQAQLAFTTRLALGRTLLTLLPGLGKA